MAAFAFCFRLMTLMLHWRRTEVKRKLFATDEKGKEAPMTVTFTKPQTHGPAGQAGNCWRKLTTLTPDPFSDVPTSDLRAEVAELNRKVDSALALLAQLAAAQALADNERAAY